MFLFEGTFQKVGPLGPLVMPLPSDQEVTGSIPSSAVLFLSSGELFLAMYRLRVSVSFVHVFCPVLSSDDVPTLC